MNPPWPTLVLLLVLGALPGCGQDPHQARVVEIDGAGIRLEELHQAVEARVQEDGEARRSEIVDEELDRLVSEHLIALRAEELGIEIPDEELAAWLERVHGPEFSSADPAYREEVRRQLAGERAALVDLAEHLDIPDDLIVKHFEENREAYAKPARVQIRQIVVEDPERARSLADELRGGADFADLAQRHSLAPEAEDGGLLPPFAEGEMPEVFDHAFDLRPDEVSEVLESPYGFHIFLLVARFPPSEPELGEVRDDIEAKLISERLVDLKRSWRRELRRRADIKVNERLLESLRR